jgi:REP element-mobilizing transposase RayT
MPQEVLRAWLKERVEVVNRANQMQRELSVAEDIRLQELYTQQVESYLDAGHGSCWLRQPRCAELVANALRHFDGERYKLHAWCVMPNHVHVIVEPIAMHKLSDILHSWKSFTATAANRLLRRTGTFWQEEYYDHLIRDADDYLHSLQYLLNNPKAAGLLDWPWVWCRRS